jgi:hypothetical protein
MVKTNVSGTDSISVPDTFVLLTFVLLTFVLLTFVLLTFVLLTFVLLQVRPTMMEHKKALGES